MGLTPVEFDKNNFYLENNSPFQTGNETDYSNRALVIASFNSLSTPVISWRVRIKKGRPNIDGYLYILNTKMPSEVLGNSYALVYDEDGNTISNLPILEGGDRYLILNYFSSSEDSIGDWNPRICLRPKNGYLNLQNDSNTSVTIQRISYRVARHPGLNSN